MDNKDSLLGPEPDWSKEIRSLEDQILSPTFDFVKSQEITIKLIQAEYEKSIAQELPFDPEEAEAQQIRESQLLQINDELASGNPHPAASFLQRKANESRFWADRVGSTEESQRLSRLAQQYELMATALETGFKGRPQFGTEDEK